MKMFVLFLLPFSLFAGQNIEYGASLIYNETMPSAVGTNRLELQMQNWTSGGITHIASAAGAGNGSFGWNCAVVNLPIVEIACNNTWDNGAGAAIPLNDLPTVSVTVRLQHDIANLVDDYEGWDSNGNRFFFVQIQYTTETDSGEGFQLGYGSEPTVQMAFVRAYSTLVPLNSIPPTTSQSATNQFFEWKVDCTGGLGGCPTGGLVDSSGNGNTAIYTGGTPTFVNTLYQNAVSIITNNSNAWTNLTSGRAGYALPLVSASYSQIDSSPSVTCLWQILSASGLSHPVWPNGNTSCSSPSPIGMSWGDHVVQLTVTDTTGQTAVSTADVGVVAQDSKCVVVNADPNADAIFGNMIAYGCNLWGLSDQWEYNSNFARCISAYGMTAGCNPTPSTPLSFAELQWEHTGSGTVSYVWGGVGNAFPGQNCANSLTGTITTSQLTIPISNASCLDLSVYPTHIVIGTGSGAEDVRITGSTATSGAATLTVAYDGRGYLSPATGWGNGTDVQQFKVTGSGTNFVTDPTAPVFPLGFASPTGPSYATATATLTAGSATVTGTGFVSSMVGSYFVATATHSSVSYVFVRTISGYTSPTSITLASVFPSDSDTGSYTYNVTLGQRTLDLRAPRAVDTTSTGQWLWNATAAESATTLYLNAWTSGNEFGSGYAPGFNTGTTYSSLPYSVVDTGGYVANSGGGGINFYCESCAWRKLWLRSGLTAAGNAANLIDDNLLDGPWDPDGARHFELIVGGPAIGALSSAILGEGSGPGSGTGATWGAMRSYAKLGEQNVVDMYNGGAVQCWKNDTRSNSYAEDWLIKSALYDPDPTWKSEWQADLTTMQAVDTACHQSDYSFSNSSTWSTNGGLAFGPVTLIHNSTTITGALTLNNGSSPACVGTAIGTGAVINGSGTMTISSGTVSGDSIAITGTLSGSPYTIEVMYSGSGSSLLLAGLWNGDTGSVTWMSLNTSSQTNNQIAFGTDNADTTNLPHNYMCMSTGSGTGVLDHPWSGTNGSAYYGTLYNIMGIGNQAFYNGINMFRMRQMANSSQSSASFYQGLVNNTGSWIKNTGFSSTGLYTLYGNVYDWCVTGNTLTTNTSALNTLPWITPACNYPIQPTQPTYLATDRAQNSELGIACSAYYAQNPTSGNKTFCDQLYGAIWGNPTYNVGGVFYDQYSSGLGAPSTAAGLNYTVSNLNPGDQGAEKWPGFYCGMGSCDEWPAYRLGGVDPPNNITVDVPYSLSGIPGASKVLVTVTEPNGIATPVPCSSSPCAVVVDLRQGNPLLEIDIENSGSAIIAKGDPVPWHIVAP